jgi:hypothetical protein
VIADLPKKDENSRGGMGVGGGMNPMIGDEY